MGLRIREPVSQNPKGHLSGHVADLVDADIKTSSHRGYQNNATMHYHCDSCDVAALLCVHQAKSGGMMVIVSSLAIHNEMVHRRPDFIPVLAGDWYRDHREEVPPDKKPWSMLPVFNYGDVPEFSDAQQEAMDFLTSLAGELSHGVRLDEGDTLFLHNHVVMHSRTEFEDFDQLNRKRHLYRLWFATSGGRPIPDAILDRYGCLAPGELPSGIVVESTKLCAPLTPV